MVGENKTDVSCGGSADEIIRGSSAKINTERGAGQTARLGHRLRYPLVLLLGAAGYPLAELCWRGRTHWSMALLGGLCLCGYGSYRNLSGTGSWCTGGCGGASFGAGPDLSDGASG